MKESGKAQSFTAFLYAVCLTVYVRGCKISVGKRITKMEKSLRWQKAAVDLTTRPLLKKIILFALPLVLTSVLQLLYNAADLIVVGKWAGENEMAAVGSTGALINLVTNLFLGLSVGALTVVARNVGAKDDVKLERSVHTAISVSVIGGLLVGIVGFFASTAMLKLMKTPANILPHSSLYLKIYFCGMPFNLLYNFGASILRACGDTKRPLIILIAAGIINVILNIATVAGLKMGVAGVGIATTVSQVISSAGVMTALVLRRDAAKFRFKKISIHKSALRDIVVIGLPAGIQGTVFSLSNVIIQSSVNGFGEVAVAANSAAANIEGFVYVAMNSVAQTCLTVAGQNYGAKKPKNIDLALIECLAIVSVVGIVLGVGAYLLHKPLLGLYGCKGEALYYGKERMRIICGTYFLCGVMEVFVSGLRAIGNSVLPMAVAIVGVCGVRILWIYTAFRFIHTPFMLYISYTISWVITAAVHGVCYMVLRKKTFGRLNKWAAEPSDKCALINRLVSVLRIAASVKATQNEEAACGKEETKVSECGESYIAQAAEIPKPKHKTK